MNRILSWKVDVGVYAYIYLPNSTTHISSRITEDSPMWSDIINVVSTWDEPTYKSHFEKMADEIKQRFGVILSYQEDFFNFADENSTNGTNIVILAGEDGQGGNTNGIIGGGTGDAAAVYDAFLAAIDAKLAAARADIEAENTAVKEFLQAQITNTISEAQKKIEETKEELDATKEEMTGRLDDATDALNKAAELFELGDGNIDGEAIKQAFNSLEEIEDWMGEYSESVVDMKTDYDAASQMMGQIGTGEDVTKGCFSKMASSMSVISGTVGTVRSDLNAAQGTISNIASWYDQYASAATEAAQYINASAATIENNVKYVAGGGITSQIKSTIDGMRGEIKDEVLAETQDGITNVTQTLNSFSASISSEIAHLAPDSALTSMGERMDAMNAHMSEWMTKTDSAMSMTMDLREDWSIESGKISSVSSMIAETGADGSPIYYVSADTGSEIVVTKTETGEYVDADGNVYPAHQAYVHYGEMLASYIKQTASSMTLSVMNEDNMTAAIKLAIKDNGNGPEGIITMVAEEVIIDADIIAKAISAKTANIGGVIIDYGSIYCTAATPEALGEYYYELTYVSSAFTHDESGNVLSSYTYNAKLLEGEPEDFSTTALTIESDILRTDFSNFTTDKYPLKYLKGYYHEPLFKLDGLSGTLYAGDARIRGSISADTGYIGNSILSGGAIQSSALADDGEPMFKLDGNTGFFLASNADVRGKVTVDEGRIGGFNIANNMLEALDAETNKTVGFLNGGNKYATENEGKLIVAAGITINPEDEVTLYKWVCTTAPEYNELYTLDNYSVTNGTTNGTMVSVYSYDAVEKKAVPLNITVSYTYQVIETDEQGEDGLEEALLSKSLGGLTYIDTSGGTSTIPIMEYLSLKDYENENDEEYLYVRTDETVTCSDLFEANTKLYGNGYLDTISLNAKDGFFGGQIDSTGAFRGRLDNAYGTLKNATIKSSSIEGDITVKSYNTFHAESGTRSYFSLTADKLQPNKTDTSYSINPYTISNQNRNGNNWVHEYSVTVANINFEANAEITIPLTRVENWYWVPNNRTVIGPSFGLNMYRTYEGKSQELVYHSTLQFNNINGRADVTLVGDFNMGNIKCEEKGSAYIVFSCYIMIPGKNGLSYANTSLVYRGGTVKVSYPSLVPEVKVGANGINIVTSYGALISAVDDDIYLLSSSQNNGLKINNSGIQIKRNGGQWTNL